MGDVENAKDSTRVFDEKHRGRELENHSLPSPSRLPFSRRLLTRGVELRGLSQFLNSQRSLAELCLCTLQVSNLSPLKIGKRPSSIRYFSYGCPQIRTFCRAWCHSSSPTVVVDLISFLSQILVGDVGPRSIRTWPPRFVLGHPIL